MPSDHPQITERDEPLDDSGENKPATRGGPPNLPPLPTEQLLIDAMPSLTGQRALVISPGRAQVGVHLRETRGFTSVHAWYLDLHNAQQATLVLPESVEVHCGADLPEEEYDLVAMPILKRGEAELTRELLQQAHERLQSGGHLITSVDNPKDSWLHEQLQPMFDKVTCERHKTGAVYWGRKTTPLKKLKNFSCQFPFRDEEDRLLQVVTRPSVFSHRRLDAGARQLMRAAEISPTDNVLDMGCGSGAISLTAAFQTQGQVFGVDSNSRAIDCLADGAELNGLTNICPVWNADGNLNLPAPVDVALANPPYFGDDHVSQHFVDACVSALRAGGALLVVNKKPKWYEAYFEDLLEDVAIFESGKYFVACGRKPLL